MLKITQPAPNRIDLELTGTLDEPAMKAALDELIEKSKSISGGKMLYRATEFSMPTLGAIGIELQRLPELFALIGKFDRCAVLSDQNWIRTGAEIKGALIPGLEIKGFQLDETEAAERWLADGSDP